MTEQLRPKRHHWLKLRLHVRICLRCGTGKVNAVSADGWYATYHRPDGTTQILRHVPPCEVGPLTEKFLAKYGVKSAEAKRKNCRR